MSGQSITEARQSLPCSSRICQVCGAASTGIHYGVPTCEGCKGFYKRSVEKHQNYRCFFGGQCDLTGRESRNRCKFCRFQRCTVVGMSLSAAKVGRLSNKEKLARKAIEKKTSGPVPIAPAPHSTKINENILPGPSSDQKINVCIPTVFCIQTPKKHSEPSTTLSNFAPAFSGSLELSSVSSACSNDSVSMAISEVHSSVTAPFVCFDRQSPSPTSSTSTETSTAIDSGCMSNVIPENFSVSQMLNDISTRKLQLAERNPENTGQSDPICLDSASTIRSKFLDDMIFAINHAGNDIYRKETDRGVEFMVKLWKEGRLGPEPPSDPEISILIVRDRIKKCIEALGQTTVEFAVRIPRIAEVNPEDLRVILQECIFEIWMLQNYSYFVNNESYVMLMNFANPEEEPLQYSRFWMSHFLPESFIDELMIFSDEMNGIHLNFLEVSILKALVVVCPGRRGITHPETISSLNQDLQDALCRALYLRSNCVVNEMFDKTQEMLRKLAHLNVLYEKFIVPLQLDKDSCWKEDIQESY